MKKILKIIGILACLGILFLNVSLNRNSQTGNIDLSQLMVTNEADAECWPFTVAHGHCLEAIQLCVFDTEEEDCDPYRQ